MAPENPDAQTNGRDWKSISANWASQQAVPTVLLLIIIFLGAYKGPDIAREIKEGYQEIGRRNNESTERLGTDLKSVAEKFDKDNDRDFKIYQDARLKDEELRKKDAELERLRDKLEASKK